MKKQLFFLNFSETLGLSSVVSVYLISSEVGVIAVFLPFQVTCCRTPSLPPTPHVNITSVGGVKVRGCS